MFNALKNGRQGAENSHDVYCFQCGLLTDARSNGKAEGWNPDIISAGVSLPCTEAGIESDVGGRSSGWIDPTTRQLRVKELFQEKTRLCR